MKPSIQKIIYFFLLCVPCLIFGCNSFAQIQTGKSYLNISKGSTGGTFEPGDTLEIRSSIVVGSSSITLVRYNDTIDNNFTYIGGSLKILTNEGLNFRTYSDTASDDAAMFDGTNKNLRINMGSTATACANTGIASATAGTIVNTNKPSLFGNTCLMVASFRVKINSTLAYNTILNLPGGCFRYTQSGSAKTIYLTPFKIALFKNLGSCSNFVGANALVENNGSFNNGITQNRSLSAIVPGYSFTNFSSNQPNDGSYGICNNTSAAGSTNNAVAVPNSARVFNVWDIIGDHTGATNALLGNPATSVGTNGGYMVVVNASYANNMAIQQNVSNLCSNTYYDFSAWFRNICSMCACDSNGKTATTAGFNGPYAPGVKPNLTFQLDDIDYYTTGDMPYTALWEKKGFTYLTGAAQTSFKLTIRNNSCGGGGNDWAIDDVSLSTCEPNVNLNITPILVGCEGTQIDFNVKVNCYFPNYTFYKWQKSTDGGLTWINTGVSGSGNPVLVGDQWEYTASYPTIIATLADSGQRYRVVAATSAANLANTTCSYSNNQSTVLKILDCPRILKTQLTSFSGRLVDKKANLQWTSTGEAALSHFELQRSEDSRGFYSVGRVQAINSHQPELYHFKDAKMVDGLAFYRIKSMDSSGQFKLSETILVSNQTPCFAVVNINTSFRYSINMQYRLPNAGVVMVQLSDAFGRTLHKKSMLGKKDLNNLSITDLETLSSGIYTVTLYFNNAFISTRAVKIN